MFYYDDMNDDEMPVEYEEFDQDLEFVDEMETQAWQEYPESFGDQYQIDEYASLDPRKKIMSVAIMVVMVVVCLALYTVSGQASETGQDFAAENNLQPTQVAETLPAEISDPILETGNIGDFNCALSERYPKKIRQWCDLIVEHANKRGLPPDLVAALIWQESGGNPSAYSHSGAVGLMQIMPRDGIAASFMCANGPCFHNRPNSDELTDPAFNISYGTKMLAGLVNKNGSLREALKSYGPMDVGYYYADKVLGIYHQYGSN